MIYSCNFYVIIITNCLPIICQSASFFYYIGYCCCSNQLFYPIFFQSLPIWSSALHNQFTNDCQKIAEPALPIIALVISSLLVANILPITNLPMPLGNLPIAANSLPMVPIGSAIRDTTTLSRWEERNLYLQNGPFQNFQKFFQELSWEVRTSKIVRTLGQLFLKFSWFLRYNVVNLFLFSPFYNFSPIT